MDWQHGPKIDRVGKRLRSDPSRPRITILKRPGRPRDAGDEDEIKTSSSSPQSPEAQTPPELSVKAPSPMSKIRRGGGRRRRKEKKKKKVQDHTMDWWNPTLGGGFLVKRSNEDAPILAVEHDEASKLEGKVMSSTY